MHALIGLNAQGSPVTPIVTWADARARDEARELRGTDLGRELHRRSGTPIHSMSPLVKLRWFAAHEPELTRRVATWAGLKDLILHRLTGRLVTELSSASGTGLLDLSTRTWDPEAVRLAGIRPGQLPEVLSTTAVLPLSAAAARRIGVPAGTPVVAGAGDGPLGNLGTGAMAPGVAGLSLGTSGALRLVTNAPYADPDGKLFCYALTERQWVIGTPVSNGGAIVRWARTVFAGAQPDMSDAALLATAEVVAAGSDGLVMLPFLLAERGPLWDPTCAAPIWASGTATRAATSSARPSRAWPCSSRRSSTGSTASSQSPRCAVPVAWSGRRCGATWWPVRWTVRSR